MYPGRASIPLQGLDRCVLTEWERYQVPTAKLEPSIGSISPAVDLHGSKKYSGETDQLTLASGGNEHALLFSVAIGWGNKMNFSLYANMAGFCSDGHKL